MSAPPDPRGQVPRGICVIMAGGRGTRFWPLSRTDRPKQLLPLASARSLLRDTYDRVVRVVGPERVLVVTSGNLAAATRAELPELPADHVVTEPVGRNTAPCAVLGVGLAGRLDSDAPVALLPADHRIPDPGIFAEQLTAAFARAAAEPTVVTFGIRPTRPETGYGYIETESESGPDGWRAGLRFVEKPNLARAQTYVAGGRHFWNSGIFVWNSAYFAECAARHLPEVTRLMVDPVRKFGTPEFAAALTGAYTSCPADSIDCAVMEKLVGFTVLPARFTWSDLGSWDAWGELAPTLGSTSRGQADLLEIDGGGNIVKGERRLVALLGVNDLVVVDTDDALLVCAKDQVQRIKEVIEQLENEGRSDLL